MQKDAEIKQDPKNARKHGERNKAVIKNSLEQCGAGRSIVLDGDNCIVAGNGVYEQAQALGLKVRVIESDGTELIAVKRTDIKTGDDKRKLLALADNRAGELAEWDDCNLQKLLSDIDKIKLNDFDLDELFKTDSPYLRSINSAELPPPKMIWYLIGAPISELDRIDAHIQKIAENNRVIVESVGQNK